jgi:hypothetical protein
VVLQEKRPRKWRGQVGEETLGLCSDKRLFVRFSVRSRGMFVSTLAMLMSRSCVLLGFVVLAE